MFYYIPGTYLPNTAATNRCISFIKGFSELGIKTTVVYFRANESFDLFNTQMPNICYKHYCRRTAAKVMLPQQIGLLLSICDFIIRLRTSDAVFCYGNTYVWYWVKRLRPKVKLYVEQTELPEVTGIGGKFLTPTWKNYYKALPLLDGLFVITTALKEYFNIRGVKQERIHIANITVIPNRFDGIVKEKTEKYIGYCGTASNNKDGVDVLIKAFAKVSSAFPDVKLYIMGPTPKKDELGNITLIKELGLQDKINLTGVIPASEMPQYLKNAEVLVLARPDNIQAKYGFATKMGEYLLSKNPVVVTRVGDFELFLKDKDSAIFANPLSVDDISNQIIWALKHPVESERIGEKGYEVAMKHFHYLSVTKNLIKYMNL